MVAIGADGRAWSWGRNEHGQLGHGDQVNRQVPTVIEGPLKDVKIVSGALGKSHTVLVDESGSAWAFGANKHGQLGLGSVRSNPRNPKEEDVRLVPAKCAGISGATSVACGAEFTAWLCAPGHAFTCGLPQYGQLGHGTDHEHNTAASSVKLAYEPQPTPMRVVTANKDSNPDFTFAEAEITNLACGHNHCVCTDANGKIWTWGNGGYGRLGHKVQRDEFSPRLVEIMGGDRNLVPSDGSAVLAAAQTCSWATAAGGQMYVWGKPKTSGDNHMYPVPFMDFQGWNLRSVSCGATTFAAAGEDQAITWGQGAGCGELGYGEKGPKSSANPKTVDSLGGKCTLQVACGVGHCAFLVKREDAEGCPVFEPKEPPAAAGGGAKAGGSNGGAAAAAKRKGAPGGGKKQPKKKK